MGMSRTCVKEYCVAFGVMVLAGCAQVSAPTGGPRDETPPRVLRFEPPNESVRLQPTELVMEFDEFLALKNPNQQLIVSPPISKQPEWKLRGKSVQLKLNPGDFMANRTYVFSFGDAVVDLHESNPAEDLKWAFSTGDALDTLKVSGRVRDRMTRIGVSGLRLLLFEAPVSWDSIWAGKRPDAVGVTDKQGEFSIGYLSDRRFVGVALDDVNGDYMWSPGEYLALDTVSFEAGETALDWLGDETEAVDLPASIASCRLDTAGLFRILAEMNTDQMEHWLLLDANGKPLTANWERDQDSVFIWSKPGSFDPESSRVIWQLPTHSDTTRVFIGRHTPGSWGCKRFPKGTMKAAGERRWTFFRDVVISDSTKISLFADSVAVEEYQVESAVSTGMSRQIRLLHEEQDEVVYRLECQPGALESANGKVLEDTLIWTWRTHPTAHFGDLEVKLKDVPGPGWLRVDGERIWIQTDTSFQFNRLEPGKVELGFEYDENGDGIWQSVSAWGLQSAEPYFYPENQPVIRSNWIIEWDWSLVFE
ncbi:MAG: Ig-like domain-containing protein [Flavobacteriales bacterium]